MRLLDFTTIQPREVAPGYIGRYVHSDQITQGRVDIAPGAVIPDHSHPHEQWTLLLSGSFELTTARAITACVSSTCFIRLATTTADGCLAIGYWLLAIG